MIRFSLYLTLLFTLLLPPASSAAIDLDTANAPVEVIIPTIAPIIFSDIAPLGMDATVVLRATTLVTNSWFDASAPYHPTAVGIYSRLGRRPAADAATNRNINIACLYATYRVLNSLLPKRNPEWREMLTSVGLNPDDNSENTTSPIGLGNLAGKAIVAARENDGMNQLGNEGRQKYNRIPYADYTGFEPANTAYELRDPSKWQPAIVTIRNGIFRVQQFVPPQHADVKPYFLKNPKSFRSPRPDDSFPWGPRGRKAYQDQVDEVIAASANLTDYQKLSAELFDKKSPALVFPLSLLLFPVA